MHVFGIFIAPCQLLLSKALCIIGAYHETSPGKHGEEFKRDPGNDGRPYIVELFAWAKHILGTADTCSRRWNLQRGMDVE